MKDIREILEREILPLVRKPGRYIGGEYGAVVKTGGDVRVRIALAFPELYEIGMSNLGLRILYNIINRRPEYAAERVYAPWPDMEALMREHRLPLYGLESFRPLREFDIIGFSLPYELTYTNVLTMLDLSGIPLSSAERSAGDYPLVIAGGACSYNPAPLEYYFDLFSIGEGEEAVIEILDAVDEWKRSGRPAGEGKKDLLARLARSVKGVYVPGLYSAAVSGGGKAVPRRPAAAGVPDRVRKRTVAKPGSSGNLASGPVPAISVVHDRVGLEVRRGCSQGCRFCQAGMIYRPVRDERPDDVISAARRAVIASGHDEVALCALSVGDYPCLQSVAKAVTGMEAPGPVSLSLPSLRPDRLSAELGDFLSEGRKAGVTLAPEAGADIMRRRINKKVSMDDLAGFVSGLRARGWRLVKLYFMIGLPGETEVDISGIADWIEKIAETGGKKRGKWEVNVTVSSFVPKPHTPFQWERMDDKETLRAKQDYLRGRMRRRNVNLKFHDLESSVLESVFSRGDRSLSKALLAAWRNGCRFDGWRETFNPALWSKAFDEAGLDMRALAAREFSEEEALPWDIIDTGVSREFLLSERGKSSRAELTGDCTVEGCVGCGVCGSCSGLSVES